MKAARSDEVKVEGADKNKRRRNRCVFEVVALNVFSSGLILQDRTIKD